MPRTDELPKGTIIAGRYFVERLLGKGGMGAVYAVHHVNTGEALALKVLNPEVANNAQAVERFRTEARAPVQIGTDHVVRVVDADVSQELGGTPFLVMEYLNGRDLATELKRRGALPAGEVCLYLRQVARALDRAHALGIIHRDLKPQNIFLTRRDDGTPLLKILDFGIAKLTSNLVGSGELTQAGMIFGTPWYMAPEQARGHAAHVTPSTDLWALGLIAFRLLTGRNYWTAEDLPALIGQICYEPLTAPSQMAPHLGPRFDEWFARACNRDPSQRFSNAAEMVTQLAQALGVSTGAQTTGMGSSQPGFDASGQHPGTSGLSISVPGAGTYPPTPHPGTYPPPHMVPPGSIPPGAYPPHMVPPGSVPPGAYPPHMVPPGSIPPGTYPPHMVPPGTIPPGMGVPPGTIPPGMGVPMGAPLITGLPGGAVMRPSKPASVAGPVAIGLLIAFVVAAGAAGAFVFFTRRQEAAVPQVTSQVQASGGQEKPAAEPAPPPPPATAAPTTEPAPSAAASAEAAPADTGAAPVAEAPSAAPTAASAEPSGTAAPTGTQQPSSPGVAAPAKPAVAVAPAGTGGTTPFVKPPPKVAPKVGNIKF